MDLWTGIITSNALKNAEKSLVDTRGLMKGGQAHQNKSLLIPLFHATDYKNLKLQPQTYQNQRRLLKLQCSGPSATWAAKVGRVLV